jgi:hypothetical protein
VREHAKEISQKGLGVEPVHLARGHEREEVPGALGVVVASDEEPRLAADGKSRFILPVSRSERGSTTRGIPRFGATWTCCTRSRVEAKTSTSASGPTDRGW